MSARDERSDKERELIERNERLTAMLREARGNLVAVRDWVQDAERLDAISNCLDYAVIAIDLRIVECKGAIHRGVVGTESDFANRTDARAVASIFESALRASGFQIVLLPEATT